MDRSTRARRRASLLVASLAAALTLTVAPAAAQSPAPSLADPADQVQLAVDGLGLVHEALATKSLTCGLDPACRQARTGLKRIWEAERDQLLPGLRQAAKGARALATGSGWQATWMRFARSTSTVATWISTLIRRRSRLRQTSATSSLPSISLKARSTAYPGSSSAGTC